MQCPKCQLGELKVMATQKGVRRVKCLHCQAKGKQTVKITTTMHEVARPE